MFGHFNDPPVQVLPVKELDPFLRFRSFFVWSLLFIPGILHTGSKGYQEDEEEIDLFHEFCFEDKLPQDTK